MSVEPYAPVVGALGAHDGIYATRLGIVGFGAGSRRADRHIRPYRRTFVDYIARIAHIGVGDDDDAMDVIRHVRVYRAHRYIA